MTTILDFDYFVAFCESIDLIFKIFPVGTPQIAGTEGDFERIRLFKKIFNRVLMQWVAQQLEDFKAGSISHDKRENIRFIHKFITGDAVHST